MKEYYRNSIVFHGEYYYYDIARKNIRKYRIEAGLTQQDLADLVGLSMNYIAQIESKRSQKYFTIDVVGKIADALKISMAQLFEVEEEENVAI